MKPLITSLSKVCGLSRRGGVEDEVVRGVTVDQSNLYGLGISLILFDVERC